jgi:uncharacterized protein
MPRLTIYAAAKPFAALLLAHGAGAGQKSGWMLKAAKAIAAQNVNCATFDFPYITAGRKVPDRAPVLEAHWREMVAAAKKEFGRLPLFIGGKSMGGRIASHIASQGVEGVRGLIFFGYPLHPPGAPDKRRDAHLPQIAEPMLFIQGSNDTFGNEAEMSALVPTLRHATLHLVPTGDHSFKVKGGAKAQDPAFEDVITTACDWMRKITRS